MMTDRECPACGESLHNASVSADDSVTCPACGARVDPPAPPVAMAYAVSPTTDGKGMAITAFVLSLVGFVPCVGIPLALIAIVLAIISLAKNRAGNGHRRVGLRLSGPSHYADDDSSSDAE